MRQTLREKVGAISIPAHWQRGRLLAALVTFLVVLLTSYAARDAGRAERWDGGWLRTRFSLREWLRPPAAPDPDIALVEMDDRCVATWPEPFIAWGPHLAAALDYLTHSGARVIALDWVQPISTEKWFPGNDLRLEQALRRANNVVFAKEVRLRRDGRAPEWIAPFPALLYAVPDAYADPEAHLGYVELAHEESEVATAFPVLPPQTGMPGATSFAARIVERYLGQTARLAAESWYIPGHRSVPLRPDGALIINYASDTGNARSFPRFSMVDVATAPRRPDARFRGKIVIIGATYTGCNDLSHVPLLNHPVAGRPVLAALADLRKPRLIGGMEVHANLVRTLLSSRPIGEPSRDGLWLMALALCWVGLIVFSRLPWAAAGGLCVLAAVLWVALSAYLFIAFDYALPLMVPLLSLLLTGGLMGGYRAFGEERERQQVLGLWGRYQDPRLVDYLLQHPAARGGEGQEVQVTVLFADLKNFTKTVQHLSPHDAIQALNRYLALMSAVIRDEHDGFVDKYLGDGLMAQWGATPPWSSPRMKADPATLAVRACLELQRRAAELAASHPEQVGFGLRLTLHSGPVVAGWVGAERLEFTIIGDTVNVTSRLQETAKAMECEFLISEPTYQFVREWVRTGKEAEMEIRGRDQPMKVYEVLGVREPDS